MAKLRNLKPTLKTQRSRLAPAAGSERERSRVRDAQSPWRAWYHLARWRKLRLWVLDRDGWQCQQTGVMLVGRLHGPTSAIVDHITQHHGDPVLFWDPDNLQAVAKTWHDKEKQRQERSRIR